MDIYKNNLEYAKKNGEREQYLQNLELCDKCGAFIRHSIAVNFNFTTKYLDVKTITAEVTEKYGFERTMLMLALRVDSLKNDGRVDIANKEWAIKFLVNYPNAEELRKIADRVFENAHPALLDSVAEEVRFTFMEMNRSKEAGHWNTSPDSSFQAHNDTELPHDEAPPFFYDEPDSDQNIDRDPTPDPNNDLPHGEAPVSRKLYISSFAIREARNAVKDKDYDRALELFSKEADKGNILAKYEIADLCRRNLCQGNAFEIYREALNGFLEIEPRTSQKAYVHYRIGRMFYDGYGTDIDYEEAFKWLKKAADEGNHLSEFVVGKMLCNGTGTEKDTEAGTEYLTRAANSGNEYAQNYLDSRTSWEQGCVVKLVGSVGRLLSENLESSRAAMAECSAAVFGHGDLSKEQIRELILKKQDKENTAEM